MTVEVASVVTELNPSNPATGDFADEGDNHLRLIKQTLRTTFPQITGPLTVSSGFLNGLPGVLQTLAPSDGLSSFVKKEGDNMTGNLNVDANISASQSIVRGNNSGANPQFRLEISSDGLTTFRTRLRLWYDTTLQAPKISAIAPDGSTHWSSLIFRDNIVVVDAGLNIGDTGSQKYLNIGGTSWSRLRNQDGFLQFMTERNNTGFSFHDSHLTNSPRQIARITPSGIYDNTGSRLARTTESFEGYFESPNGVITPLAANQWNHGLGGTPRLVTVMLVCTAGEHGYSVGDEVNLTLSYGNSAGRGGTYGCNATQVYVGFTNYPHIMPRAGGTNVAISAGSWRVKMRAWR